eukprot:6207295-Pleurochrysis_carterae.AAC.1
MERLIWGWHNSASKPDPTNDARLRHVGFQTVPSVTHCVNVRRVRAFCDVRAAASLGGYHFHLARLARHLPLSPDELPPNATCTPLSRKRHTRVRASPGSQYFLQRIAGN